MLQTKTYPIAAAHYMSFTNAPLIKEHNFKLVRNKAPSKTANKRRSSAVRKAMKRPDPIRSAKSTLAWNIIYAQKVADGWWPEIPSKRFKAFLQYQKAQVVAQKAEAALNKSKANQGSTIDCAYLVASNIKPALASKSAPTPKRKSRLSK